MVETGASAVFVSRGPSYDLALVPTYLGAFEFHLTVRARLVLPKAGADGDQGLHPPPALWEGAQGLLGLLLLSVRRR